MAKFQTDKVQHEPGCFNSISILGSKDDIDKFRDWVGTEDVALSFEKAYPIPEAIKVFNPNNITPSFLAEHKALDLPTWKDEHWGQDRDAINSKLEASIDLPESMLSKVANMDIAKKYNIQPSRIANYSFTTHCHPPIGMYKHFSDTFPSLIFHISYDSNDEAHGSCGWAVIVGGDLASKQQYHQSYKDLKVHMEPFTNQWVESENLEDTDEEEEED